MEKKTERLIYLDNAATSFPKPEAVYRRIDEVLRVISGNPGRASHRMALEASRVIFSAREAIARLFNVRDASRIAFTKNATEGINIALKGLLKPGGHVVTSSFEHNSVVKTLGRLERNGVRVTKVRPDKDGLLDPKDIASAIDKDTKIVCISHASNVFGTVQPIEEIGRLCRNKSVIFMVDGAQTAGAMPIEMDAMNMDIFAATGHKALFGPQGTGFLYVREGIEPEPLVDGGTGELNITLEMPDRLESGTMNTPGVGGLGAGVEFILKEGIAKVKRYEEALIEALLDGLRKTEGVRIIGPADAKKRTALVAFNIAGKTPAEVGMRLDNDFSIMVRTGAHCAPEAHREAGTHPDGAVRVSPGYFTKEDEVEEFLRAIREIAK
ncbi:MAG: aminotransferase class V-fold PLP-dependent enzyme [Deltaproteobacteria bacterium]|nr:aminotransferase class V-fold PLP-dependent enzyme [Deltaproteobacteria bacterium]